MKYMWIGAGAVLLLAFTISPEGGKDKPEKKKGMASRIDTASFDKGVRPQDDFFYFCNGTWVKNTEIPAEEKRWSSFNELDKMNKEKLREILKSASKSDSKKGSTSQLIGDYNTSFLDSKTRNERGAQPIEGFLREIAALKSTDELPELLAKHHRIGVNSYFGSYIYADLLNPDKYSLYVGQGGLGLKNKDYYTEQSESKEEIRREYKKHIARMLTMAKVPGDADEMAENIYKFEHQLAEASMGPVELRNPAAQYNPYTLDKLQGETSGFDWKRYFAKTGISDASNLIVSQPAFFAGMEEMFSNDIEIWKQYLSWKVINSFASHLSDEFDRAHFKFYGTVLTGVEEMKPSWKRAIDELTRNPLGEALGKAFVEQHFTEESKKKVNELVDNLFEAYRERLTALEWMSDSTKEMAFKKLNSFGRKLGYPDKWKDLSSINIQENDYLGNVIRCHEYEYDDNVSRLGKPVDKDEWGMPPHMVNAYYNPLFNEIAFPAGIMQPPFFDPEAEDAVNYARIGMVIGHEITHGFDDMGSQFDENGSMRNWWTESDKKRFKERSDKLGEVFQGFCPFDGICVNPGLTMGENIADLGGATMAYYAYLKTDEAKNGKEVHGYSPEQRFFINLAQLWKYKIRPEALKEQIATDPHSPAMYRVNGPLMNMPEFYDAFGVKHGDHMHLKEEARAVIW